MTEFFIIFHILQVSLFMMMVISPLEWVSNPSLDICDNRIPEKYILISLPTCVLEDLKRQHTRSQSKEIQWKKRNVV